MMSVIPVSYSCVGCTASTASSGVVAGTSTPNARRLPAVEGGAPLGNATAHGASVGAP